MHRKNIASALQRPAAYGCIGKECMFAATMYEQNVVLNLKAVALLAGDRAASHYIMYLAST
jgi:hypothetical protein